MRSGTALAAILALCLVAGLAGYALARVWAADPMRAVEAEAAAAWAAAWLPYRVCLTLAAGLLGLGALGAAAIVLYRWADNRGRSFYPDAHGVMPAVILRPGEVLADLGALPGPLELQAAGPTFPTIAAGDLLRLQAAALQGAALTRTMRAWASREVGTREASQPAPWAMPAGERAAEYPPVEVLTGDPAHVYRLLASGEGDHGA